MVKIESHDPAEMDPATVSPPPISQAINFARITQLLKQHGVTGAIIILLCYQLGFIAQAQTTMCGV